jgi:hypothetical protein
MLYAVTFCIFCYSFNTLAASSQQSSNVVAPTSTTRLALQTLWEKAPLVSQVIKNYL